MYGLNADAETFSHHGKELMSIFSETTKLELASKSI
jgi:hypothetical protein